MTVETRSANTLRPSDKNKTLPQGKYLIEVAGVGGEAQYRQVRDHPRWQSDGGRNDRFPVVVAAKKEPLAKSGPQELKSPETVEAFWPLFNGKETPSPLVGGQRRQGTLESRKWQYQRHWSWLPRCRFWK